MSVEAGFCQIRSHISKKKISLAKFINTIKNITSILYHVTIPNQMYIMTYNLSILKTKYPAKWYCSKIVRIQVYFAITVIGQV